MLTFRMSRYCDLWLSFPQTRILITHWDHWSSNFLNICSGVQLTTMTLIRSRSLQMHQLQNKLQSWTALKPNLLKMKLRFPPTLKPQHSIWPSACPANGQQEPGLESAVSGTTQQSYNFVHWNRLTCLLGPHSLHLETIMVQFLHLVLVPGSDSHLGLHTWDFLAQEWH